MIAYYHCDSNSLDFRYLTKLLDMELGDLNGNIQGEYTGLNDCSGLDTVIVAYDYDKPLACGCLKPLSADAVEIKRIFVVPEYRRQHIASALIDRLETLARELKFQTICIETGKNMTKAIGLYQRLGYQLIPNYGPYADKTNSVCFNKKLPD